jgi:hypothetical protein
MQELVKPNNLILYKFLQYLLLTIIIIIIIIIIIGIQWQNKPKYLK